MNVEHTIVAGPFTGEIIANPEGTYDYRITKNDRHVFAAHGLSLDVATAALADTLNDLLRQWVVA